MCVQFGGNLTDRFLASELMYRFFGHGYLNFHRLDFGESFVKGSSGPKVSDETISRMVHCLDVLT